MSPARSSWFAHRRSLRCTWPARSCSTSSVWIWVTAYVLLLNRYVKKSSVTPAEVEQIVGAPVEMAFPNDYTRVTRAIQDGKGVDPTSELGKCYAELGAYMLQKKLTAPEARGGRFVEYFNISPARFRLSEAKAEPCFNRRPSVCSVDSAESQHVIVKVRLYIPPVQFVVRTVGQTSAADAPSLRSVCRWIPRSANSLTRKLR